MLDQPQPDLRQQVESALLGKACRLVRIASEYQRRDEEQAPLLGLDQLNPQELFSRAWESAYGSGPDAQALDDFASLLQSVELATEEPRGNKPFHEDSRHPPEEPRLPRWRAGNRLHPRTAVQRRPVRHHRSDRRRQEHRAGRPVPGPVRQHAAAGKHFGQQQGSRWPERAVQQRRTQPAAPRLRQRLRRSGFRRHRRPPLSRPLGNPALRDKADGALQKSQQSLQDLETQQMLAANKKASSANSWSRSSASISPSSLAPCCWPRANSAPSSRPATTTAAHCWRNSPTPACTAN